MLAKHIETYVYYFKRNQQQSPFKSPNKNESSVAISPLKMEESDEEPMETEAAEEPTVSVPLPNLLEARAFMLVQVGDKEEEKQLKRYILAYPF